MRTIGERIKHARKEAGLTQEALAKKLRVVTLTVSKWETGVRSAPRELIPLARALNVSPLWILTGEGAKKAIAPVELEERRPIPLIGFVAAGAGAAFDVNSAEETTYAPKDVSNADYALEVIGDSMEPKITHGDICYCKLLNIHLPPIEDDSVQFQVPFSAVKPYRNKIVVCTFNGVGILKKLELEERRAGAYICRFVSLNQQYEPLELGREGDCRIQGFIIGIWRKVT